MKFTQKYARSTHTAALGMALMLLSVTGCANPPAGTGRVIDEQGQPVAGVHVLAWRMSTYYSMIPFGRSSGSCDGEHYEVTGTDGSFTIPRDVIKRPFRADLSYFLIVAHKKGLQLYISQFNPKPRSVGSGGDADIVPTTENPLRVMFTAKVDIRPAMEQALSLWKLTYHGCTSCNPFRQQAYEDSKGLYTPPPNVLMGDHANEDVIAGCKGKKK